MMIVLIPSLKGSIGVMGVLTLGSIGDGCCLKGWDGSIGVMGAVLKG